MALDIILSFKLASILFLAYFHFRSLLPNLDASWNNRCAIVLVPDVEAGCCLGPEGNGVSSAEGDEGGPAPRGGKDMQSVFSEGRDNLGKDKEDRTSQT